ncbi:MAG: NTP transferase domain-containing protein [Polyangiaceae bacterium]|nr:NTP transferase domain-containing protein [Polyangiaceae bacterium]
MSTLSAIVLAAGQGKRMVSALPKVLHHAAGRPLVHYPVRAAFEGGVDRVVVVASPETRELLERDLVAAFGRDRIGVVVQSPPRGTGDAARVGLEDVTSDRVLILCGDTPLLQGSDLLPLVSALDQDATLRIVVSSAALDDPTGYGRILRDQAGRVIAIREHRDLERDDQRAIREVNSGHYAAEVAFLRAALAEIRPANAQGEIYLTDAIEIAASSIAAAAVVGSADGLLGVNDRTQLVVAEELLFSRVARRLAAAGVTVRAGARIDDTVAVGPETTIEGGARLRGTTRVGRDVTIDVGAVLDDCIVGDGAVIGAGAVVAARTIAAGERVPPHGS